MASVDLTALLVCVFSFLLSLFCLRAWMRHSNRPSNFPPGPPGLPILGNVLSLAREPHLKLTAWWQRYGDVFSLRMGPQDVVVLNGCAAIREALVRKGAHFSDRPSLLLTNVCDSHEGLIMANYSNKLRSFRRFGLSVLRHFGVGKEKLEAVIRHECMVVVKCFQDQKGRPFQVSHFIQTAVCNIIASIVLGRRFEADDPDYKQEVERVDRTFQLFLQAQPLNFYPALRYIPGFRGMFREWLDIEQKSKQWYQKFIDEHRETFNPTSIRDLIDMCLLEIDNDQKNTGKTHITEESIRHLAQEFFDAGTETTTTTLQWALLFLALNPAWQQKVQEELDAVLGSGPPSYSRRGELPYTEAAILESQRIRTTVPLAVPHATSSPTSLRGYHIPAGTQVWVNLWSAHMDPAYWTDPDKFDPSRFLDENGRVKIPESFMPFSAGRRLCVGEQLARMELFLFLTSLLQHFTFKLPEGVPQPDMSGEIGATLLPRPHKLQAVSRRIKSDN